MTEPKPDAALRHRRQKPSHAPLLAFLLFLGLVVGLAAFYLASRPRLIFTNRLAAPVRVAVDSGLSRLVPPGKSGSLPLPGKTRVVVWEIVPTLSADGYPMGEVVRGSAVVPGGRGKFYRSATPRGAHGDYFAPLITNASDDMLRLRVNAGLEGALDCACAVRPGATRAFVGYYRLYGNSTVEARTGDGRKAIFRDLGPSVVAPDATIGLRFGSGDLRRR